MWRWCSTSTDCADTWLSRQPDCTPMKCTWTPVMLLIPVWPVCSVSASHHDKKKERLYNRKKEMTESSSSFYDRVGFAGIHSECVFCIVECRNWRNWFRFLLVQSFLSFGVLFAFVCCRRACGELAPALCFAAVAQQHPGEFLSPSSGAKTDTHVSEQHCRSAV